MSKFGDFLKGMFNAKAYTGLILGNLPISTNWGANDYLRANDISLYTNRGIAKRAEKVGEVRFEVRNQKGEVIQNHPILNILKYPNPVFTGEQFWGLVQSHIDLVGAAYIVVDSGREIFEDRKVTALHLLMPTGVKPKLGADGKIAEFEYKTSTGTTTYQADQVIYIFRPDPKAPLFGISLLKAGVQAIQTEVQISAYHARVLENGGKIEGVFKFKTPRLTKEQIDNLKAQYEVEYADSKNTGRPLFLGGDAEYMKMGLSPSELSFLDTKRMTLEDIVIMTGVPKPLLGSFDDIQYSNADAAIRIFLRETINPLLRQLTVALDKSLLPDGQTLTYIDPTPENVEEKLKETESGIKNYWMTINEARKRHGLDPVADGDVVLVPFNLIPLGEQSVVQSSDETEKAKVVRKTAEDIAHPLRDPDVRKQYGIMVDRKIASKAKLFKRELKKYFKEQEDRLIAQLQPSKTRIFRKENLIEEILQVELEVKIGKEAFLPILTGLLTEAGQDAVLLAESSFPFRLSTEIKSWLDNKTEVFLRQINETTLENLKGQFSESLANGETRDQLVDRVKNTYETINTGRAEVIARTEVHGVVNYGTMRGYEQAGLPIKIWVTVGDFAVRDTHAAQDGEERPINTPFSNGLMFPGDPKGDPSETVNCRCVI